MPKIAGIGIETAAGSRMHPERLSGKKGSSMTPMFFTPKFRAIVFAVSALLLGAHIGAACASDADARPEKISSSELIASGHRFFGNVSRDLAMTIQEAVSRWGEPNGYILGEG